MPIVTPEELQNMDVLQRLNACRDQLTRAQKQVADYFMENMMEAAFSTVDKAAHAVGVSTTTVVRLANTMGYSGYAELQAALKKYLTTMSAPISMFSTVPHVEAEQGERDDFTYIADVEIQNLRDTCAALDSDTVDKTVDALCRSENIYVIGARNCEGTGRFLAYNLDRMFLNTRFLDGNLNQIPEIINRMTERDTLVLIGFSRYLRAVGEVARLAKALGVTVVAISDSRSSPWSPYADYIFVVANQSSNFFHSPIGIMYVSNVLLRGCARKNSRRVEESLQRLEKTTQSLQIFIKK